MSLKTETFLCRKVKMPHTVINKESEIESIIV